MLAIPDAAPLERFGAVASDAVAELLENAGIETYYGHHATEVVDGSLRLSPERALEVDRVVSLPRLRGPHLAGLPSTEEGFIPTDHHGLVEGTNEVYAAGDATAFPVKHGGVSIDQATAVAEAVAARLGAPLRPKPFRPVLRGLLLTGAAPQFLWSDPAALDERPSSLRIRSGGLPARSPAAGSRRTCTPRGCRCRCPLEAPRRRRRSSTRMRNAGSGALSGRRRIAPPVIAAVRAATPIPADGPPVGETFARSVVSARPARAGPDARPPGAAEDSRRRCDERESRRFRRGGSAARGADRACGKTSSAKAGSC